VSTADASGAEPVERARDDPGVDVAGAERDRELDRLRQRVAELEAAKPVAPRPHRVRRVLAAVLGLLTVLALVAGTVAVWLRATAFDTDEFMAVVEPALESPETAAAVSSRLTDEVLDALSLEDRIGAALSDLGTALGTGLAGALDLDPTQAARIEALPIPGLDQLAAPIASGLEERIATRIDEFVTSGEFRELLSDLVRAAHPRAVALIRGDEDELPNLVVQSGEVQVDLVPVVARALADLVDQGLATFGIDEIPLIDPADDPEMALERLSQAVGVDLPPDFGKLTVMSQGELTELQDGVRTADRLVWALVLGTVVLAAATVAVAPDRRRVVVALGVGVAVGLVVTMLLLRNATTEVAGVAVTAEGRDAVLVVTDTTLDSLRTAMLVVLVVALVVAVAAHLAGRPAWARRSVGAVQRGTAPRPGGSDLERFVAGHLDVLRVGVVAVGVLVLWWTGITVLSVAVVAGLVLLALWGLVLLRDRTRATA
jgi:hypothetical protein